MSERLFQTKDRDEAHKMLERVLIEGSRPNAECREYPNEEFPYQVWSDAESSRKENKTPEAAAPPPPPPQMKITFTDEELFKIGEGMAIAQAKMKALGDGNT